METVDKRRQGQFASFVLFALVSAFWVGYLFYHPPTFSTVGDWVIVAGAIFFSIMAITALCGMLNGWTAEQEDKALGRTMGFVVFAPVALIVAALVAAVFGIILFSAFGWLATIPSWAAVIIVLLVLIYLKK
jgi:uncharacterized protein YacL